MILDHTPLELPKFGGLYGRGTYDDNVPRDHYIDSLNTIGTGSQELRTRWGFSKGITLANIRRIASYKKEGEATRVLALDNTGKLFDTSISLSTPILNIASMTDFAINVVYNRAYISPHDGITGLTSEVVYVYNGSGTARAAAGSAPVSGFTATVSATAGTIESGTHIFAWCYETDTGFITPPSAAQVLVFDGTKAVDFTSIPTGPTGTAARRLIASKAIQSYNGDEDGYEMFFVSGGRIANNTATTLSAVSFYDNDLQLSADYTYDQLTSIPAGTFICSYDTRICIGGSSANRSLVYVSKKTEPESISSLSGFIVCDPQESDGVKAGVEYRKNLYITKGNPGKTYTTIDNTYDPSTWNVDIVDKGIGADINGISAFMDSQGANAKSFLSADSSGIYVFDGAYSDFPLTYKIDSIWRRINSTYLNKVQIVIDPKQNLVYALVPLDNATSPSHILVGDYTDGLNPTDIVWHIWSFGALAPVSILVALNNSTKKNYLRWAAYAGNVYDEDKTLVADDGVAIDSYVQFALQFSKARYVHHFAGLGLRIRGSGSLAITARGEDAVTTATFNSLTLATSPGKEYLIPLNFTNEKCSIKLRTYLSGEYWTLSNFILYAMPVWATRPA